MLGILDLDGTLIDRDGGFALWLDRFCEQRSFGPETRGRVVRLDRRVRERGRFFELLVSELGLAEDPVGLWRHYRSVMPQLAMPFVGVLEGVAVLADGGWTLAVLSNGQRDNQLGKLRAAGLADYVSLYRFSGDTGLRKPDPAAFRDVLHAAGWQDQDKAWMVGDDPELDIVGAAQLGLSTMWISHGRPWPAGLTEPTRIAASPAQALHLLAQTSPPPPRPDSGRFNGNHR